MWNKKKSIEVEEEEFENNISHLTVYNFITCNDLTLTLIMAKEEEEVCHIGQFRHRASSNVTMMYGIMSHCVSYAA